MKKEIEKKLRKIPIVKQRVNVRSKKSKWKKIAPEVIRIPPLEVLEKKSIDDVPISLVRITTQEIDNTHRVYLKDLEVRSKDAAKVYIAKGPRIIDLINNTNLEIRQMHKNGEIDLSADAY